MLVSFWRSTSRIFRAFSAFTRAAAASSRAARMTFSPLNSCIGGSAEIVLSGVSDAEVGVEMPLGKTALSKLGESLEFVASSLERLPLESLPLESLAVVALSLPDWAPTLTSKLLPILASNLSAISTTC